MPTSHPLRKKRKKQGVTEITLLTFVFYVKGLQLFPRLLLVFILCIYRVAVRVSYPEKIDTFLSK